MPLMTVASSTHSPAPQTSGSCTWAAEVSAPGAATSCALIDLEALTHNARLLATLAGRPWMAVVKADAYGHGLETVARTCLEAGATWLGVAQLDEALHLRELLDAAGVARPEPGHAPASSHAPRILCWLMPAVSAQQAGAEGSALRAALAAALDLSVSTLAQLEAVAAAARAGGQSARVHLKVDTGMSRAGAVLEDLPALAQAARQAQEAGWIDVVGLWSHLSRADEPDSGSTQEHLARFRRAEQVLTQAGLRPRVRHLSATGGLEWHPQARLDLVRVGIGLYGFSPEPAVATSQELGLRPVMRLQAPLVQVKRIPDGQAVSYGGTWRAPTDRWVGLVPLGYGDGIPRAAASAGPVWVAGRRTTVVGKVCMDQVVIDLGPATDAEGSPLPAPAAAGDLVIVWGDPRRDGEGVPTAEDWARVCSTISYEVLTRLGPRVPRVPVG